MQLLKLQGIDGQQLLGFLTALGTLSLLDKSALAHRVDAPKLAFEKDGKAILQTSVRREELTAVLLDGLQEFRRYLEVELRTIAKPADFSETNFKEIFVRTKPAMRSFLAGLACVIGEATCESTLCAANGASRQNLVQSMRDVLKLVEEQHLGLALFDDWRKVYRVPDAKRKELGLGDRKPTLRLDVADDRLYAHRLSNPTTTDDFSIELGAQALAIPAFALLPVVPTKRPLTVASKHNRNRVNFSWGLWDLPATIHTVKSIIWAGSGTPKEQRARGVFARFSVDRVTSAKGKLTIAPARGEW